MFKNTASQKLTVFAFDSTTNLPKTGDGANLTAYVSKDDGTLTVLADTTATEVDSTNGQGYYTFDLAQAETNGDKVLFAAKSSTANIVVMAVPSVVYTVPASFTSLNVANVNTLASHDPGATLGTGTSTLTTAQVASAVWQDTTAGDFTVAASVGKSIMNGVSLGTGLTVASVAGSVGSVTGAVGSVTGAVGSVTGNVGGNVAGSVASVTGAVGSVTGNVGGNVAGSVGSISGVTFPGNFGNLSITAGGIAKADLQTILATAVTETSAGYLAASFKKLFDVATPVLTTASVNQTGDSYGRIGATGSGLTSLAPASTALSTAQWTSTRAGYLDNLDTTVSSRLATSGYTAPLDAAGTRTAVGMASANLDTQLAGIVTDIGSPMQAGATVVLDATQSNYAPAKAGDAMTLTSAYDAAKTASQAGDAMTLTAAYDPAKTASQAGDAMALTSGERTTLIAALFAFVTEGTETFLQAMRLMRAVLVSKCDGFPSGTKHFRDGADTKNRLTVTSDADGNRTSITTDGT